MPRLDGSAEVETHNMGGNFSFTAARVADLGATEYTLVDIEVDMSGSVRGFLAEVVAMVKESTGACRKSPRSDNLLVRVATFSSRYPKGINEVHGFIPLDAIDPVVYDSFSAYGGTPLFDATFTGVGAINSYAKMLFDQDYQVNAISFVITDGEDNESTCSPKMIADEVAKAQSQEILESHISVLIGINDAACAGYLDNFRKQAGITQYISAGDATKGNLAKLAAFVSQSISSTSQALGTGGPSQSIAATI